MKDNRGASTIFADDRDARRTPRRETRSGVSDAQDTGRELIGDFAGADDLLWAAQTGRPEQLGPVRVLRSGRIGPLVEILMARRADSATLAMVTLAAPFAVSVEAALARCEISGMGF